MSKSSKEQIDADEKKILWELQKNSKESIDKIAKKCGFSRQKVWRVIKRLEKDKTIWGYHAVVDDNKKRTYRLNS
jgi:DNA-binding Lrp family transcriptional regulator